MHFGSWYTKMTHSEVKKTVLRVFLVLALCLFMVRGTIYSNGLSRYGRNVCEERKYKSVSTSTLVSTVSYQSYTTKCGFFGWGRCRRSRTVTGYKWKTIYRWTTDIHLKCCYGWSRENNCCSKAICSFGCNNGGTCNYPNRCTCTSYWTGSTCSVDIDECGSSNGGCQQICNNRKGQSRTCSCYRGYKTNPYDFKKCVGKRKLPIIAQCVSLISHLIVSITKYSLMSGSQKPMIEVLFQVGQTNRV